MDKSVLREGATNLGFHGLPDAAGRLGAATARASLGVLVDEVASTATANVVVWSLLIDHLLLAGKLLIEAEDGTLGLPVEVTSAAAAGAEVGVGLRSAELGGGSWALGVGTARDVLWVYTEHVASAATAVASHVASWDRWVWLGDAVVARHCDCCSCECEKCCGDVDQVTRPIDGMWRWMMEAHLFDLTMRIEGTCKMKGGP